MSDLRRYVVFHDYYSEGWKVVGSFDTILEAVQAREKDLANGGGTSLIFEHIPILQAYCWANQGS